MESINEWHVLNGSETLSDTSLTKDSLVFSLSSYNQCIKIEIKLTAPNVSHGFQMYTNKFNLNYSYICLETVARPIWQAAILYLIKLITL